MKYVLICEAVFPENKGGLERWMSWLASELVKQGHEVTYLNAAAVSGVRNRVVFSSVSEKPWHYVRNGQRSIIQSIRFALGLLRSLPREKPDVVYSVQAPIFSLFALSLLHNRRWVLVIEWIEIWPITYWKRYLGENLGRLGFWLQQKALKFGDIRVTFTKRCFEDLLPVGNKSKNLLLPGLCMDLETVKYSTVEIRNNIVFLGRFVAEKQPLMAIDIVRAFHQEGWKGKFYIVGSGTLKNEIELHIAATKCESFIEIVANASDAVVSQLLEGSFLLLHPSRREGYGLSMIEAALRGVPTLLINYPDNASVDLGISPELVVEPDDIAGAVQKINLAHVDQSWFRRELQKWTNNDLPKMSAEESVRVLMSEINAIR
jgi:glycosyltransferase involved in cell wall biosynthesis